MDDPSDVLVPVAMYDDTDDAEQAAKALVAVGSVRSSNGSASTWCGATTCLRA